MNTSHVNTGVSAHNWGMCRSRRSRIALVRQQYVGSFTEKGLDYRECPPETIKAVRDDFRARLEAEKRRQITLSIVMLFVVAVVLTILFVYVLGRMKL